MITSARGLRLYRNRRADGEAENRQGRQRASPEDQGRGLPLVLAAKAEDVGRRPEKPRRGGSERRALVRRRETLKLAEVIHRSSEGVSGLAP